MSIFDEIEGLQPVDPEALKEFEREMKERVIPEIEQAIKERIVLAEEARHRVLF